MDGGELMMENALQPLINDEVSFFRVSLNWDKQNRWRIPSCLHYFITFYFLVLLFILLILIFVLFLAAIDEVAVEFQSYHWIAWCLRAIFAHLCSLFWSRYSLQLFYVLNNNSIRKMCPLHSAQTLHQFIYTGVDSFTAHISASFFHWRYINADANALQNFWFVKS